MYFYTGGNMPFQTDNAISDSHQRSVRVIHIDGALSTMLELLDSISHALETPYKKLHWDSFQDMLTELDWLDDDVERIVFVHYGLPSLPKKDILLYISCLDYANEFWDRFDELSKKAIESYTSQGTPFSKDCWVYHKLSMDIYFREEDRAIVKHNIELAHKKWGYPYRF